MLFLRLFKVSSRICEFSWLSKKFIKFINSHKFQNLSVLSFDLVWFLNQEARLAEAKAAKAAKEAKEAKEKRAREAAEQLRRDKATDASSSNKRSPPSSSDEEKEKEKRKRRRIFFCLEWIEASNMMENDGYDGHCRCTVSIRFAQAQVQLRVL